MSAEADQRHDAELVAAVRAGDTTAFAVLVRRHRPSLERLCRRLVRTETDAQDVVQEALVQAFVGIDRLRRPESFAGWLHAIGANIALKTLRRPRPLRFEDGVATGADDGALEAVEARDALAAALAVLSREQRTVLVGHLAGYTYGEIASHTGVRPSTVRGRLFQSRVRLRAVLSAEASPMREEIVMEPVHVVPAVYGTFRRSTDRVLVLTEAGGTHELALRLPAADAAAVEAALGGSDVPADAPHELAGRLLRALDARVVRATVEELSDASGHYAALTIARGDERHEVSAAVSAGLALAAADDAAVLVAGNAFARNAFDPADPAEERRRHDAAERRLAERIAAGAVPQPVPSRALPPETRRAVEAVLAELAAQPDVWLALLVHRDGALQSWAGSGEAEALGLYAAAAAGEDDELAELAMNHVFPPTQVRGGIRFDAVARHWRLEVAVAAEWPQSRWDQFEPTFAGARAHLEALLESESGESEPHPGRIGT